MNNNIVDIEKIGDKKVTSETLMHSPSRSKKSMMFQIFFLTHDQSQNVEVVETNEINCGEIIQRLKSGESVFIKYKNLKMLEPDPNAGKDKEKKPWYFARC